MTSRLSGCITLWVLAAVVCLSESSTLRADKSARVRDAEHLYDEADAALRRGEIESACRMYEESDRLDPQLGTKLHLADCYERQGKLASAWLGFQSAVKLAAERNAAGGHEPREAVARSRASSLESRVSTLTVMVKAAVPGMAVLRDGRELPARSWGVAEPIDGGAHLVEVTAPGRMTWKHSVRVADSQAHIEVHVPELELEPTAALPPPAASSQVDGSSDTQVGQPLRTIGYVVAGLGIVAGGIGIGLGVMSANKESEMQSLCANDVCRDQAEYDRVQELTHEAKTAGTWANVLMVTGVLSVSAGVAMVLLAPREAPPAMSLRVAATPYAANMALSGRF